MRTRFKRRPLAAAMLMTIAAPPLAFAQAQQEKPLPEVRVQGAPEQPFRVDETRGATRTETPLRDIPQFINEVPQSVIRSQNASTLQEALRNVPGISYAAPEGGTQVNQVFFLRGFPIFGDLFVDGVRDLGEYNRDLFATERVEVLKGPSALMFGRGSTGGLINQVSKVADRASSARKCRSPSARSSRSGRPPTCPWRRANRVRSVWRPWPRTPAAIAFRRASRSTAWRLASSRSSTTRPISRSPGST